MISSLIIRSRLIEGKSCPFPLIYPFIHWLISVCMSSLEFILFCGLTHNHHYLFYCFLEHPQSLLHPFKSLRLVIVNLSAIWFWKFAWWSLQNVASIVFIPQGMGVSPVLAIPTQVLAGKQKVPGTRCGARQVNPTRTSLSRDTWSRVVVGKLSSKRLHFGPCGPHTSLAYSLFNFTL